MWYIPTVYQHFAFKFLTSVLVSHSPTSNGSYDFFVVTNLCTIVIRFPHGPLRI